MSYQDSDYQLANDFIEFAASFYNIIKAPVFSCLKFKLGSHAFQVLFLLKRNTGSPFTMSVLADKMQITKQQLTKLINDLEDQGYVERVHDRQNRRQVYIFLTEAGVSLMEEIRGQITEFVVSYISQAAPEENAQLLDGIHRLMPLFKHRKDPMQ